MRRRYIYFLVLLTYFHNSSKKEHITKHSIKSTINSTEAKILFLPGHWGAWAPLSTPVTRRLTRRPVMF